MNRKVAASILALSVLLASAGAAFAEFNYSVFEESGQFVARVDAKVGAGNISFAKGHEEPFGDPTKDGELPDGTVPDNTVPDSAAPDSGNFFYAGFDILMLPNAPAVLRAQFAVAGTLINAKKLTLQPEETRYIFKVDSNPSTSNYEGIGLVFPSGSFPMIEEILEKGIASVKYVLSGDYDILGEIPVNLESLQTVYSLYQEAGGLEQDFSGIDERYPFAAE